MNWNFFCLKKRRLREYGVEKECGNKTISKEEGNNMFSLFVVDRMRNINLKLQKGGVILDI